MICSVPLHNMSIPVYFAWMQHTAFVNCLQVDLGLIQDFDLFSHKKFELPYIALL